MPSGPPITPVAKVGCAPPAAVEMMYCCATAAPPLASSSPNPILRTFFIGHPPKAGSKLKLTGRGNSILSDLTSDAYCTAAAPRRSRPTHFHPKNRSREDIWVTLADGDAPPDLDPKHSCSCLPCSCLR